MRYLAALLWIGPVLAQQTADQPAKTAEQTAEKKPAESPAPAAAENWITGDIDFGYRWLLNNQGNFEQYRSVVNLGEGPKLFGLDFTIQDPKRRLFDRLDVRANGWGGDPYNTAHLNARKERVYDFSADYRNIAYFNAIPSYANPLYPAGLDEQSFDIHRRNTSLSLDLFPGTQLIPYIAYDRNSGYGSGIWTWVQGANNEYAVPSRFSDHTDNIRGGIRWERNRFHITLEEGATRYRNDDNAYNAVPTRGDRTGSLLGQNLFLNGLLQSYGIRGDGSYTKLLATGRAARWIEFYGQALYSEPQTTVHYTDLAQGNFAELSTLMFYSTQMNMAAGTAVQPHILGSVGFEARPFRRLRVIESLNLDRSHDAASPLVTQQYLASAALGPVPAPTLQSLNYKQVVNYNQQQIDVLFDLTNRITLHAGYRFVWGDATVLAGSLTPAGTLSGELHRNVGIAGLTFRATSKLSANLDYEGASSDRIYFRTSLNDYHRARARLGYQATASLSVQARFQVLDNQNPDPSIRYDFRSRDNAVSLFWSPAAGKRFTVMGEYDRSTLRSDIRYLDVFFAPAVSSYRDNAHTATSAITMGVPGHAAAHLTVGGSLFISSGSRPSRYYQPLVRLAVPFGKNVAWNTEWQWYGYGEQFYLFEGFRTHIFMTGLRVSR